MYDFVLRTPVISSFTAQSFSACNEQFAVTPPVKRGPGSFVVEGGAAVKDDGTDGAVGLFLFESRAKTVDAGVAV